MFKMEIVPQEKYNQQTWEFYTIGPKKPVTLRLEHSLISISKWESRTQRKFLYDKEKPQTKEDYLLYLKCMSLDNEDKITDDVLSGVTDKNIRDLITYIETPQTATTFGSNKKSYKGRSEVLSSELIYYYMGQFNLPWSAEKWHLSRLIALINVANVKGQPPKKMSQRQVLRDNAALNKARRKAMHTKG